MSEHLEILLELFQSERELLNVGSDRSLALQIAFCRLSFCFCFLGRHCYSFLSATDVLGRSEALRVPYTQRAEQMSTGAYNRHEESADAEADVADCFAAEALF